MLVGNKCDLHVARKVPQESAIELASQLNCHYYESSAREGAVSLIATATTASPTTASPPTASPTSLSDDTSDTDVIMLPLAERKRSNSADESIQSSIERLLGSKRWSSHMALNEAAPRSLTPPRNCHVTISHSTSENESDVDGCDPNTRRHPHPNLHQQNSTARKLLRAAGKLSPLFTRRAHISKSAQRHHRLPVPEVAITNDNSNNNNSNHTNGGLSIGCGLGIGGKSKRLTSPTTIPGLIVHSFLLSGSIASVAKGELAVATGGAIAASPDKKKRRRRNACSATALKLPGEMYCADPFVQLCRDARDRRRTQTRMKREFGVKDTTNGSLGVGGTTVGGADGKEQQLGICRVTPEVVGFQTLSLLS